MHYRLKIFIALFFILNFSCFSEAERLKFNSWELIISRPENSSHLQYDRLWFKALDENGNDVTYEKIKASYEWLTIPDKKNNYLKRYYLDSGMAMHLLIQSGKYKISFYTPPESQNGFPAADGTENARQWESNEFFYDTNNPAKVIFVSPTANENGFYNGGWYIDYKAPPYYQFTKPKMQY